nr:hypothetical protein [Tanacetum cinerariifolium]
ICINCTYGDGKPVTCDVCEGPLRGGFCLFCGSRAKNSYIYDPNAYSFNNTSNNFNHLSLPQFKNYFCDKCGNNSHYGYECQQQFPLVYKQELSNNQNYNEYIDSPIWNCPVFFYDEDEECTIQYREYLEKSPDVVTTVLPNKEPEYSFSMGYEHPNTTLETKSDEIIMFGVEELVPIPSECEVSSEDKRECDVLVYEDSSTFEVCDDHSEILSNSNDADISSDDDAFEDIEYVEASLPNPELVSLEEENIKEEEFSLEEKNDVYQENEEVDLEDIFQIQDVVLREKLLRINRLITNIKSLNDNPTPDCVLKYSTIFEEPDNSFSDNSSPEFETFFDQTEETRSGSTTTHDSLPEYDSFCFEIEHDQERLINVVKNDMFDVSSNDPLLEEANLFLALDNSIPSNIENFGYDSEGEIYFRKELLIDDSIPFPNNESFDFEDDPLFLRPPPEPPDAMFDLELDFGEMISAVMNTIDELNKDDHGGEFDISANDEDDDCFSFMFVIRIFLPYLIYPEVFPLLLSAESEYIIFDPGISV